MNSRLTLPGPLSGSTLRNKGGASGRFWWAWRVLRAGQGKQVLRMGQGKVPETGEEKAVRGLSPSKKRVWATPQPERASSSHGLSRHSGYHYLAERSDADSQLPGSSAVLRLPEA